MKFKFISIALLALSFAGACGSDDMESPDGEFDVAFADGKADSMISECDTETLLSKLNNAETSVETLKDAGIHTRAANNIIEKRDGADALPGSDDDYRFGSLVDVDDVSYVGPVAMGQLLEMVAGSTCDVVGGNAEVIFSPQPYDQSHLAKVAELIDTATHSLDIAMYSYSDAKIGAAIGRAKERGIDVRFIFETANEDKSSPENTKSSRLEDMGVDVRYVNKIMHHKFVLIDGPRDMNVFQNQTDAGILATGSGNWSNSAGVKYDENTLFMYGNAELNLRYQREFNHLWANSRDFSWNPDLEFFESDTIASEDIDNDSAVDAVFTSANFKVTQSSRYGATFSSLAGRNTVADRLVDMISSAQDSIWVASGHLRSRPIAEAILAAKANNPNLDVRVYLDGQEFIAESTSDLQDSKLNTCLEAAGTSVAKKDDCLDRGFYFSYAMKEAGIPLQFKYYSYRWHYTYAAQMHHKYLIIDGKTLAMGSYNLSDNAEHNTMENVTILDGSGYQNIINSYIDNFNSMWKTGEGLYEPLMDKIENGTGSVPIVFDSMSLSWDEVNTLKSTINRVCSNVNDANHRRYPERNFTCTRR